MKTTVNRAVAVIRSCTAISQLKGAANYAKLQGGMEDESIEFEVLWQKLKLRGVKTSH